MTGQQLGLPVPPARQLADALEQFLASAAAQAGAAHVDRDPDAPLLYSIEGAAAKLGDVGRDFVYGLIRDGALEAVKLGRLTRITHTSLLAYIDRLRNDAKRGAA